MTSRQHVRWAVIAACVFLPVASFAQERQSLPIDSPFRGGVPQGMVTSDTLKLSVLDVIKRALDHNLGVLLAEESANDATGGRALAFALAAVIIPALASPFGLYLMKVYAADAVPTSMIEAARLDGAGEWRIFTSIALRLLRPGLVTVLLFTLVATWNNYFLPLIMLNSSDLYPITVGLAQLQSAASQGGGSQALFSTVITGSLVSIVPLVLAFLFLQRYWQSGLATGSVKE